MTHDGHAQDSASYSSIATLARQATGTWVNDRSGISTSGVNGTFLYSANGSMTKMVWGDRFRAKRWEERMNAQSIRARLYFHLAISAFWLVLFLFAVFSYSFDTQLLMLLVVSFLINLNVSAAFTLYIQMKVIQTPTNQQLSADQQAGAP